MNHDNCITGLVVYLVQDVKLLWPWRSRNISSNHSILTALLPKRRQSCWPLFVSVSLVYLLNNRHYSLVCTNCHFGQSIPWGKIQLSKRRCCREETAVFNADDGVYKGCFTIQPWALHNSSLNLHILAPVFHCAAYFSCRSLPSVQLCVLIKAQMRRSCFGLHHALGCN